MNLYSTGDIVEAVIPEHSIPARITGTVIKVEPDCVVIRSDVAIHDQFIIRIYHNEITSLRSL